MSNKMYILLCTIITAVCAVASAVVSYFGPALEPAINSSINIIEGAALGILGNFAIKEVSKKLEKKDS